MERYPDPNLDWPILYDPGVRGLALQEQYKLTADGTQYRSYKDITGKWTGPWGLTEGVAGGETWSFADGDQDFCDTLTKFTNQVKDLCTNTPDEHELCALVSLAWNIGIGEFSHSSVLKYHNAGNPVAAANAFSLFNKCRVNGVLVVNADLVRRRATEAALYLTGTATGRGTMPQSVAPEPSIANNPTAQSGAALTLGGAATGLAQYSEQAKTIADNLGFHPSWVLIGMAVFAGVYIIVQQFQARKGV